MYVNMKIHTGLLFAGQLAVGALIRAPATVRIEHGDVVGLQLPSGVRNWMGVPYAKSPPERFSPPQDPVPWNTPLQVIKVKPSCMAQHDCRFEYQPLIVYMY